METNLKMRREKYFPGIHKFEKLLRWLWSQFRSSCSDLEWKKPTTVNSQHVQEGYESFHMAVSDLEDTFHGLYIFRTRSQGLTALVSVSDGKIPITILILRRGPCLHTCTHHPLIHGRCRQDLFRSRSIGFVCWEIHLTCFWTNPAANTHVLADAVCMCGAKQKYLVDKNQAAYCRLGAHGLL